MSFLGRYTEPLFEDSTRKILKENIESVYEAIVLIILDNPTMNFDANKISSMLNELDSIQKSTSIEGRMYGIMDVFSGEDLKGWNR